MPVFPCALHNLHNSGVNSDPAMRGGPRAQGAQNSGKNFFTQQFACTHGFGRRDKEEEGPIGFLAGGPKI